MINDEILADEIYELGNISNVYKLYKLQIVNNDDKDLMNKTLRILPSGVFNRGDIPVSICEYYDNENLSDDNFKKELNISLSAFESKSFILKIKKDYSTPSVDLEYRFVISLV